MNKATIANKASNIAVTQDLTSQLRLGNIIMVKKNYHEVVGILPKGMVLSRCVGGGNPELTTDHIAAGLTDEMLIKSGFITKDQLLYTLHLKDGTNRRVQLLLENLDKRNKRFALLLNAPEVGQKVMMVENLHELQNFIYCYSGKELQW